MILKTTETFCATHHLPHQGGKCMNLHGHNYKAEIEIMVDDSLLGNDGMIIDFGEIKTIIDAYDHAIILCGAYESNGINNRFNIQTIKGKDFDNSLINLAEHFTLKVKILGKETTAENMALAIANEIGKAIQDRLEIPKMSTNVSVTLWETDKHAVLARY